MPFIECKGRNKNQCWSPGRKDTDCPYHGLCCYDGCANTCYASTPPPKIITTTNNPRPTLSCPTNVYPLPLIKCKGRNTNQCWSPGKKDTDCPEHGLCCYDGCAYTCHTWAETPPTVTTNSPPTTINTPPTSECIKDSQCDEGKFCEKIWQKCIPIIYITTPPTTTISTTSTINTPECLTDNQCDNGEFCEKNWQKCIPITTNITPPTTTTTIINTPHSTYECLDDTQCDKGEICEELWHTCIPKGQTCQSMSDECKVILSISDKINISQAYISGICPICECLTDSDCIYGHFCDMPNDMSSSCSPIPTPPPPAADPCTPSPCGTRAWCTTIVEDINNNNSEAICRFLEK